jgi:hypothetical protein
VAQQFSILHSPFSILRFTDIPAALRKKVHSKKKGQAFARPSNFYFTKVNYFTLVESSAPALKRTTFLALI